MCNCREWAHKVSIEEREDGLVNVKCDDGADLIFSREAMLTGNCDDFKEAEDGRP